MALDPFFLQHTMDPEPVETCLLDNDDSEVLSGSLLRLRPQLGKTLKEPSDVAGTDRVPRHPLARTRR
ncbi:hypothetical protein [Sphingomonas koreensis]|uniref:hypothetical protein n=1 Tax=Sphingomonas koreensis TaxID=93064 RepID=UPI003BAEB35A